MQSQRDVLLLLFLRSFPVLGGGEGSGRKLKEAVVGGDSSWKGGCVMEEEVPGG